MNYSKVIAMNQFDVLVKYVITCCFLLIELKFHFSFHRVLHKKEWAYTASSCIMALKLTTIMLVETVHHKVSQSKPCGWIKQLINNVVCNRHKKVVPTSHVYHNPIPDSGKGTCVARTFSSLGWMWLLLINAAIMTLSQVLTWLSFPPRLLP